MTITNGVSDILAFIQRDVVYAEYEAGTTWTRMNLQDIRKISNTKVGIYLMFDSDFPDIISGIRLYNTSDQIWAEDTSIVIDKSSNPEGILYRFTVEISTEDSQEQHDLEEIEALLAEI